MRHSQINAGGIDLHVVEAGSGPPVLFCHGFPDAWIAGGVRWRRWRRQATGRSPQLFSDLSRAFAGLKVQVPAFFLWGAVDGLTKVRDFGNDTLRPDVPDLRDAVRLPDIGHWPHREAPDITNRLLVEFLREVHHGA